MIAWVARHRAAPMRPEFKARQRTLSELASVRVERLPGSNSQKSTPKRRSPSACRKMPRGRRGQCRDTALRAKCVCKGGLVEINPKLAMAAPDQHADAARAGCDCLFRRSWQVRVAIRATAANDGRTRCLTLAAVLAILASASALREHPLHLRRLPAPRRERDGGRVLFPICWEGARTAEGARCSDHHLALFTETPHA